jgi:hypothetical protein
LSELADSATEGPDLLDTRREEIALPLEHVEPMVRSQSYYWTEHGRSVVMCPFTGPEIWSLLRHPPYDELEIR